jgi:hypothetical protein
LKTPVGVYELVLLHSPDNKEVEPHITGKESPSNPQLGRITTTSSTKAFTHHTTSSMPQEEEASPKRASPLIKTK